jgi:GTP-binding protein
VVGDGSGVGDMLDEAFGRIIKLRLRQPVIKEEVPVKIALIGRTNVGKSSLGNALVGQHRLVVSAEAHTTRTSISVNLVDHGQLFEITDTAGINRSPTHNRVAKMAQQQTLDAVNSCDVALLVTDSSEPLTHQDRHLAGVAGEVNCGLIVVANKWDLLKDRTTSSPQEWERAYRRSFPFLDWAPIVFTSAASNQGLKQLLEAIKKVHAERGRTITDNALGKFLKRVLPHGRPRPFQRYAEVSTQDRFGHEQTKRVKVWFYELTSLEDARAHWDERFGGPYQWPTEEAEEARDPF